MVDSGIDYNSMQGQLLASADKILATAGSLPVVKEDSTTQRKVHFEMQGDNPIIVHFDTAMDISLEQIKTFCGAYADNMNKITPAPMSFKNLEDLPEGRKLAHHRSVPPMPLISARSMICTYYTINQSDEEFTFIASTLGNEPLVTGKHKDLCGSDVIAEVTI